jgi:hypothetical protein
LSSGTRIVSVKKKEMNRLKLLFIFVIVYALSSCTSIYFAPKSEKLSTNNNHVIDKLILDEDGNIIVKSGSNKDNRVGYYFDQKERKCVQVFYSTGSDCVPPPFKTLQECVSCNGRR